MQEKEIVGAFLKHGRLLSPGALAALKNVPDSDVYAFASRQWAGAVVGHESLQELLSKIKEPTYKIISILKEKPATPSREVELAFFASRYEKMKRIYTERLAKDWVSIANAPPWGEVWLLGIVRDIREGEKTAVELEDPTGGKTVVFEKRPDCGLDEMVAIKVSAAGGVLFGKECAYPDVPLRAPAKGKGRGCFVSDLHLEEAPWPEVKKFFVWLQNQVVDWLFVAGGVGDAKAFEEELPIDIPTFIIPGHADTAEAYPQLPLAWSKKNIISLSNPAMLEIGGLKILMCHEFSQQQLRRRHLGPAKALLADDSLCVEQVPDVVHHGHDHKPFVSNYKSVTMVNAGSLLTTFRPVIIDFDSRDWRQAII
jgi:DNA polymerase II small subunit